MIRMRSLFGAIALSFCLCTSSAQAQYVHTRGQDVLDGNGKKLQLQGINLGNWLVREGYMWRMQGGGSPTSGSEIDRFLREMIGPTRTRAFWKQWDDTYITRDDIKLIKKAGFNSVRVPFDWKYFDGNDAEGFRLMDRLVGWCREEGIYVVLDMHAAPGGQTGTNIDDSEGYPWLWEDAGAQQQTIDIWRKIAKHYRNEKIVLGYDLLNEPIPDMPIIQDYTPKLEPLYKRIAAAIREVDKNHTLILGGAQWDNHLSVFGPPFDKNIIYQVHVYKRPAVQATVDEFVTKERNRLNAPVWMGETGQAPDQWIGDFARLLEKNNIGWCYWTYKKMSSRSGVVSFDPPEHWDEIVAYSKTDRSVGHTRKRLQVRPSQKVIDSTFASLLENIRYDHEHRNISYIHALFPDSKVQ